MSGKNDKLASTKRTSRSMAWRRKMNSDSKFVTKKELKGGQLHVPSNPPDVTYQPWYPLTVVHSGSTNDLHITVKDLVAEIRAQLDPTGHGLHAAIPSPSKGQPNLVRCLLDNADVTAPVINLRLLSVRAWNLTGRIISLSVEDFTDINTATKDTDALCGLVDTGSATHVPAVGYELPFTHRNIVLRNDVDEGKAMLYHIMAPATDTYIVYTNILWKFDGPAKILTGFENAMLKIMKNISANVKTSNAQTNSVSNSAANIAGNVRYIADNLPTLKAAVSGCHSSSTPELLREFEVLTRLVSESSLNEGELHDGVSNLKEK